MQLSEILTQFGIGGASIFAIIVITTRFLAVLRAERSAFDKVLDKHQVDAAVERDKFMSRLDDEREKSHANMEQITRALHDLREAIYGGYGQPVRMGQWANRDPERVVEEI